MTPPARPRGRRYGVCLAAAWESARAGPTDKTSEALPVVPGDALQACQRSKAGAEGRAPLTDFAVDVQTVAGLQAGMDRLPRRRRRPLGRAAWT